MVAIAVVSAPPEITQLPRPKITDSCNRAYSDLDARQYLFTIGVLCSLRTLIFHPLNIALARKQTMPQFASMKTTDIMKHMYRHEGGLLRGLTKGWVPMVVGCGLAEVVAMGSFEYLREYLPIQSSVTRDYLGGYVSDVMCRAVLNPCVVFSNRMMVATGTRAPRLSRKRGLEDRRVKIRLCRLRNDTHRRQPMDRSVVGPVCCHKRFLLLAIFLVPWAEPRKYGRRADGGGACPIRRRAACWMH